jgi:hypothetical protein
MLRVMYFPRHAEESQITQNQILSEHVPQLIEQCVTLQYMLHLIYLKHRREHIPCPINRKQI